MEFTAVGDTNWNIHCIWVNVPWGMLSWEGSSTISRKIQRYRRYKTKAYVSSKICCHTYCTLHDWRAINCQLQLLRNENLL